MLNNGVDLFIAHPCKSWHTADPIAPCDTTNTPLLQRQGHKLLSQNMIGQRWRHNRLDIALLPQVQQRCCAQEGFGTSRQEQAVPAPSRSSTAPPETLQKR